VVNIQKKTSREKRVEINARSLVFGAENALQTFAVEVHGVVFPLVAKVAQDQNIGK